MKINVSGSTLKAYDSSFKAFRNWCSQQGVASLPARSKDVSRYLRSRPMSGLKPASIERASSAINYFHNKKGMRPPSAHEVVKSLLREVRASDTSVTQKAPATVDVIHAMLARINADSLQGKRDRALLLLGFAGAFRRSELVAITVEDLTFSEEGVDVFLPKSKTDQEAKGQSVAVLNGKALKPADRLKEWLTAAEITSGPIFRRFKRGDRLTDETLTDQAVALIVKKYAEAAGFNMAEFSGESLRAGYVVSQERDGRPLSEIALTTRHKLTGVSKGLSGYSRSAT